MDAFVLQLLNGLDKGSAYALIALGLTLIFGTLGVVNFAHGALFMIGAFCTVVINRVLSLQQVTLSETEMTPWGTPREVSVSYAEIWFGDFGTMMIDYSVFWALLLAIPVMLIIGIVMERGLIRHLYKRPHADQILVTFGLAIVLQEVIKQVFGASPIPQPAPAAFVGSLDMGVMLGMPEGAILYPIWRLVYFVFAIAVIGEQ